MITVRLTLTRHPIVSYLPVNLTTDFRILLFCIQNVYNFFPSWFMSVLEWSEINKFFYVRSTSTVPKIYLDKLYNRNNASNYIIEINWLENFDLSDIYCYVSISKMRIVEDWKELRTQRKRSVAIKFLSDEL